MRGKTPKFPKLPPGSALSLRDQICELVSTAIASGALAPGQPLPSCRALAAEFGVSRNTVFAAYGRLTDQDFVIAQDRSGYVVNPLAAPMARAALPAAPTRAPVPCPVSFPPDDLMPVANPLDLHRYPYPFIYNQIDPALFPVDGWRECTRQALGRKQMPAWANDSVESDSPHLIEQLRQRLLTTRGIYAEADEILITLGSQNALFVLGTIFAPRNKPVALEDPGFFGARNAFRLSGNRLVGVPVDPEGLVVPAIPRGCQLVFTTPSHQFPTMVTMSMARREALIAAASDGDFMVIEDDYEAEMNYLSRSTPPLRAMDRSGRVIYVGSLSKTVSPGIRLGFIVAHRDIIRQARIARGVMMRHPPTILQEIVALFFRLGHYDAHLRDLERRYEKRWHAMNRALGNHLSMLGRAASKGGTSFWLTGPSGFDAAALALRLSARGVLVDRGCDYYLKGDDNRSFRLGFAYVPLSRLEEGVRIIAEEVEAAL